MNISCIEKLTRLPLFRATLLFLCLSLSIPVFAQYQKIPEPADRPLRIEIPARSSNETYRVIPCGTNGFILFFRSQEVVDGSHVNWYFSLYDTNMQQVWVKSIPVQNDKDYRFHQNGIDTLALLFVSAGKSKSTENNFEIMQIVFNKGTFVLNMGKLHPSAEVAAFGISRGRAWLGINLQGQPGIILNIRLKQGAERSFPLGLGNLISVRWMKPDTNSTGVTAIVSRQISKKGIEYYLVRYDTAGSIKSEVMITEPSGDRELSHFQLISTDPGVYLMAGSYGQGSASSSRKNKIADESTGFFTISVGGGVQKQVNYYNFLELQNAGSLLDEKDIMNLKKKALKKNKKITEYSLDFPVLLHDFQALNNQFILTMEIYTPQYHTENFTDFDYYGRPYTNSYSVFDGYRFANAIVAGFDKEGKLIWDNTMEIRNLVSMELTPKVVIFPSGNDQVLCYLSDGKIGSKIIKENNVVEKLDFASVELLYPEDKLLSEMKGTLIPWYANYFLSYGYQEIKNIALESNNKRLVFYLTKLRFEK
ncbi:MAG: hypothetical protein ACOYNU_02590 [Bacteroidales bacterium]